jgi:hypothetical protein
MSVGNEYAGMLSSNRSLSRRASATAARVPLAVCAALVILTGVDGAQAQSFAPPVLAVANFGYNAGGWQVDRHPRLMGDVNGDGPPTSSASATPGPSYRSVRPMASSPIRCWRSRTSATTPAAGGSIFTRACWAT